MFRHGPSFFVIATVLIGGLATASCSSMGSKKLVSSHTSYNDAVQLTVTREVLANIVRSRYADPMQFMAVSAINAQFAVSAGVSAGAGGIGQTYLRDPHLRQMLDRYATYSGSDPRRAPGVLSTIPYVEQTFGAWHVPGGLRELERRHRLSRLALGPDRPELPPAHRGGVGVCLPGEEHDPLRIR